MPDAIRPFAPHLSFLPFSLPDLVEDVREAWFPQLAGPIPVFFVEWKPLACAVTSRQGGGYPAVYVHQVLNHPQTPYEVLAQIAKHELLHFVVRPRYVPGHHFAHPPEFWAELERIAPETDAKWAWVHANLASVIDHTEDGVHVRRTWRRLEMTTRTPWYDSDLHLQARHEWQVRRRGRRAMPRPRPPVQLKLPWLGASKAAAA